jgi:uncharacterized protein YukE
MHDIETVHNTGTRKPVFCITDLKQFSSLHEVARYYGVTQGAVSWVITGRMKTLKGKRFCLVKDMPYHADEITAVAVSMRDKASKYDAILAEQERERLRVQKLASLKAEQEKCEQEVAHTMHKLESIMNEIKSLEGGGNQ